jgi:hypothetical protein
MPTPLEITFHGPFVFRFGAKNAWAYAPNCDEHYLNILTDTEDVRLPTAVRTFNLRGPTSGTTVDSGNNLIITCPWYYGENGKAGWPDTEKDWHYVLKFPAPDYIFGLVPEYVWIYGYPEPGKAPDPSKPENSYYARALRFRYESSNAPQFDEFKDNKIKFSANHLGGHDPGYSIEIRYGHYASVPHKKEEYYLDAQSCFESMRENLPPCDEWKVVFGKEPAQYEGRMGKQNFSVLQAGSPSGPHDCGAAVMALLDEGVSLEPVKSEANISSTKGKLTK